MSPQTRWSRSWLNVILALLGVIFVTLLLVMMQFFRGPNPTTVTDQFKQTSEYAHFLTSMQDLAKLQQSQVVLANVTPAVNSSSASSQAPFTPPPNPVVTPPLPTPWYPNNQANIQEKVNEYIGNQQQPVNQPVNPITPVVPPVAPVSPVTPATPTINKAQLEADLARAESTIKAAAENQKQQFQMTQSAAVNKEVTTAQTPTKRAEETACGITIKNLTAANQAVTVKKEDIEAAKKGAAEKAKIESTPHKQEPAEVKAKPTAQEKHQGSEVTEEANQKETTLSAEIQKQQAAVEQAQKKTEAQKEVPQTTIAKAAEVGQKGEEKANLKAWISQNLPEGSEKAATPTTPIALVTPATPTIPTTHAEPSIDKAAVKVKVEQAESTVQAASEKQKAPFNEAQTSASKTTPQSQTATAEPQQQVTPVVKQNVEFEKKAQTTQQQEIATGDQTAVKAKNAGITHLETPSQKPQTLTTPQQEKAATAEQLQQEQTSVKTATKTVESERAVTADIVAEAAAEAEEKKQNNVEVAQKAASTEKSELSSTQKAYAAVKDYVKTALQKAGFSKAELTPEQLTQAQKKEATARRLQDEAIARAEDAIEAKKQAYELKKTALEDYIANKKIFKADAKGEKAKLAQEKAEIERAEKHLEAEKARIEQERAEKDKKAEESDLETALEQAEQRTQTAISNQEQQTNTTETALNTATTQAPNATTFTETTTEQKDAATKVDIDQSVSTTRTLMSPAAKYQARVADQAAAEQWIKNHQKEVIARKDLVQTKQQTALDQVKQTIATEKAAVIQTENKTITAE